MYFLLNLFVLGVLNGNLFGQSWYAHFEFLFGFILGLLHFFNSFHEVVDKNGIDFGSLDLTRCKFIIEVTVDSFATGTVLCGCFLLVREHVSVWFAWLKRLFLSESSKHFIIDTLIVRIINSIFDILSVLFILVRQNS